MENIPVCPGESIGMIKLGMEKGEVEQLLKGTDLFYKIEYNDKNLVSMIEAAPVGDVVYTFQNLDLFHIKAEELVDTLDKLTPYDRDNPELGYSYTFPVIGLAFWRPVVLTEQDTQEEWFKELPLDIQEDEMHNFYFQSISVYLSKE
jgi:hypothetical protein